MILYHYTAKSRLESILREGLSRGEAPISATRFKNAVNMTTDSRPDGHGLDAAGKIVSEQESAFYAAKFGWDVPAGTKLENKKAVRLKVKLPSSDRSLKPWLPWARKHAEPDFLDCLMRSSGGIVKARTWWLYFGTIPPSAFVSVDHLA